MIYKKAFLFCQNVGGMDPVPPPLSTYLHYFYFICIPVQIYLQNKSKSTGNFTKLTNKWKNHCK